VVDHGGGANTGKRSLSSLLAPSNERTKSTPNSNQRLQALQQPKMQDMNIPSSAPPIELASKRPTHHQHCFWRLSMCCRPTTTTKAFSNSEPLPPLRTAGQEPIEGKNQPATTTKRECSAPSVAQCRRQRKATALQLHSVFSHARIVFCFVDSFHLRLRVVSSPAAPPSSGCFV